MRALIAGIFISLTILAPNPQSSWAQEAGQASSEQVNVPLPAFWLIDEPGKPDKLTEPCEPEREKRESDLCAQWKAADAAKKSADWGANIGLAGAFIGILTFIAAVVAAKYAAKAVTATREIGYAQLRPYVGIDSVEQSLEGEDEDVRVFIHWKNSGQTPAYNIVSDINHRVFECEKLGVVEFSKSKEGARRYASIGPQNSTRDISRVVERVDIDNGAFKNWIILMWGWIEYSDTFPDSKRHRTEFCISLVKNKSGSGDPLNIGTETEHNGADEDCMFKPST